MKIIYESLLKPVRKKIYYEKKEIITFIFAITICTLSGCTKSSNTIVEENNEKSNNDEYFDNNTQVNDWLTIELPEGYTISEYKDNVGNEGGVLIEPQAYEVLGEDSYGYGMDWTMSGSIGIISNVEDIFIFEDKQGIDLSPEDTTSDYWYFFFTKEDGSVGYYLALDQRQFTKEDALNIAKTVKFVS